MSTGFVWHERYMWHDTGSAGLFVPATGHVQPDRHVESPEAKRRIRNLMEASGLIDAVTMIRPRPATRAEVLRYHTPGYIDRLEAMSCAGGGDAGMETPFAAGGYEIALLSAGGVIAAAEAVVDGAVDNAYALVRPPGHHAEADIGKGFCLLANAVLAIVGSEPSSTKATWVLRPAATARRHAASAGSRWSTTTSITAMAASTPSTRTPAC